MIPLEKKTLVLSESNFLNVIQLHVPLEKNGSLLSGYCPLCYDEEESFLVYPSKQTWHCYACQQEGNINNFIEKTEHLSAENAIKFIEAFIHEQPHIPPSATTPLKSVTKNSQQDSISKLAKTHNYQEKSSQQRTPNSQNDDLIEQLLTRFHNCHGCQGIAIIDSTKHKLIGSSINDFSPQDIETLNVLFNQTLQNSKNILGEFDVASQNTMFRMKFSYKGSKKKLIWLPQLSQYNYTILLLLDEDFLEKILLMKLKNYFNSIA